MAKYQFGIPYMGSKSKIAPFVVSKLPSAENFYDLFGGGFAISHCALLQKVPRWKKFIYNEIAQGLPQLIQDSINGKYSYENFKPQWVSREEFFLKKDSDTYIKVCWSFGNNQRTYLFGKEIEPYKKSLHNAVIFNQFDDIAIAALGINKWPLKIQDNIVQKRLIMRNIIAVRNPDKRPTELQQLQQLQQLQRLQQLQQLQQLQFYNTSYELVPIKDNSIIYCDPPYKGTAGYNLVFDFEKFYKWADEIQHPVFISEYNIDSRFKKIASIGKRSLLSGKKENIIKSENLYCNKFASKLFSL